jgi:hypothetical protein
VLVFINVIFDILQSSTNVQITKEGWGIFMDIGMCQILGMDVGIYDMPTCTYQTWLEVKVPCAYWCIKFCTSNHVKSESK